MNDFFIDLGVAALLRVIQSQKERHKYARALAKVFIAISRAAESDAFLNRAIVDKAEEKR